MILQALVDYYEILAEDESCDIPKKGYSIAKVSYALNISKSGELASIVPLKTTDAKGKKYIPQSMEVPEQVIRTVGVAANFLCDNSSYVLGFDGKGKPDKAEEKFLVFRKLHEELLGDIDCETSRAVLSFLKNWDYKISQDNPLFSEYLEDIYKGANFIFQLEGEIEYVHQNKLIREKWEEHILSANENCVKLQCLVTGKDDPVARLHPNIKGVKGGQAMGNLLVSFNDIAYESYGNNKGQGMNAPTSEYAAFAYGTVLNMLLADNAHRISFGDTTVVFWAKSKNSGEYQDIMSMLCEPDECDEDTRRYKRDDLAAKAVKSFFGKLSEGRKVNFDFEIDENVQFYILGISPNAARLSVRFFLRDTFGNFLDRLKKHYTDISIEKQLKSDSNYISIWKMLNETVSPVSKDKSASPVLAGSVFRSVLTGAPYPEALFDSIMIRIRAEKNINYYKAAVIKAYLLRCENNEKYKEVLNMGLNKMSKVKPYVLGRLFAILERAQVNASGYGINTTIKDKYFSSACATPALVFPVLLNLAKHHVAKTEFGWIDDERICEIMELLDVNENPFPKNLSLAEQGIFNLGYYHQKNKIHKDVMIASKTKKKKELQEKIGKIKKEILNVLEGKKKDELQKECNKLEEELIIISKELDDMIAIEEKKRKDSEKES